MITVFFENPKNSKRKKIGEFKTNGEATSAVVRYASRHRLPLEDAHHIRVAGYDVYDLGIFGKIIVEERNI